MKLENQVCTLEQAERLKELGVKQISMLAYNKHGELENDLLTEVEALWHDEYSAAYTVAEMRMAIGIGYTVVQTGWRIYNGKTDPTYSVVKSAQLHDKGYYLDAPEVGRDNVDVWAGIGDEQPFTDGDAHGRLLIYLLENYTDVLLEVNQRLQNA